MKVLKHFTLLLMTAMLLNSCVKDDIDSLQGQIDDLNDKVEEYEAAQQAALLAQIEELQKQFSGDLDELAQLVEDNSSMIHYGNVLTAEDFAAVQESGASIVSGKVVITNVEQLAMISSVEMIGNDLSIKSGVNLTIENIQHINGTLSITGLNEESATVSMPKLLSVGNGFEMFENDGLTSFVADMLVYIDGDVNCEDNEALMAYKMPKLDVITGDLYVYNMNSSTYQGELYDIDLSYTDVLGDVVLMYIGNENISVDERATVTLGNTGNLEMMGCLVNTLGYSGTSVGSLNISDNKIYTMSFDNCTEINGSLNISNNNGAGFGIGGGSTVVNDFKLSAFDKVTYIDGDVYIASNTFEAFVGFNAVELIGGSSITLNNNGLNNEMIEIFNVVNIDAESDQRLNVRITERTKWFNSFAAIEEVRGLELTISAVNDENYNKLPAVLHGFNNLVSSQGYMQLIINEVTEFDAFHSLSEFGSASPYLGMQMPSNPDVTLCSMATVLNSIAAGEFDQDHNPNYQPVFYNDFGEVERNTAIETLTTGCTE